MIDQIEENSERTVPSVCQCERVQAMSKLPFVSVSIQVLVIHMKMLFNLSNLCIHFHANETHKLTRRLLNAKTMNFQCI